LGRISLTQPLDNYENNEHDSEECQTPGCERCATRKPFTFPQEIVTAYKAGNLVIFAGAGVSTESAAVFKKTFYKEIKDELKIPNDDKVSFSKLMSLYSSAPRSRKNLLLAIKKRIEYVRTFPELYRSSTEFHKELSTIPVKILPYSMTSQGEGCSSFMAQYIITAQLLQPKTIIASATSN